MAEITIRVAKASDISTITRIYADAVISGTASFELAPPDEAEMARRYETLVGGGYPYLVAESSGAVAGYAYAGPYRARPAYRYTVENSVYVRPDCARQGMGRCLMGALLSECATRDFQQVIAVIGDSANVASIKLHEILGFRRVGTLRSVGFKFQRWWDTVLMQRELGDRTASA